MRATFFVNKLGYIDAEGKLVLFNTSIDYQNCTFKYTDKNKKVIENFLPLTFEEVQAFIKETSRPYKATDLAVFDVDEKCLGYINIGLCSEGFGQRIYRVGLLSDTHYNDNDTTDTDPDTSTEDISDYDSDFLNALTFFEKKQDVSFVCCAGDVTSDNITHVKNFRMKRDKHCPNTPVYSCKGNHDNAATYDIGTGRYSNNAVWRQAVSTYDKHLRITRIGEHRGDGTSFYLEYKNKLVHDIYVFLDVYYDNGTGRASSNETDNMINDEDRTHYYYHPDTLIWFEEVLEKFKHNRVFVFTHLFFRQKAGNNAGEYYQYYSPGRERTYTLRGIQFIKLNELNNKYKNSIWFTGHTHYAWYWQKYDSKINVCNYDSYFIEGSGENGVPISQIELGDKTCDSAYNIHIPSLARPLQVSYGYSVDLGRSEGGIMDVYKDYVDIRGIIFKTSDSNDYINKYYGLATYRIPVGGKNIKKID